MKKLVFAVLVTGLVITGSPPSNAGEQIDRTLTCPIGGETYVVPGTLSCTNFGQYFDMRQITSCEWVKWPPVCPSNGFPVFKHDFSDAEIAYFTTLVDSDLWKKSRQDNLPRFMLYVIKKEMTTDHWELAVALLPAFWDAFEQGSRHWKRYALQLLGHYQEALKTLDASGEQWWTAQLMLTNLVRRLGHFEKARERISDLPLDKLEQDSPWLHRFTALNKIIKAKNSQPQPVPEQRQTAGKSHNLSPEVPCPPGTIEDMSTGQCTR